MVTSADFLSAWRSAASINRERLLSAWSNSKSFTSLIFNDHDGLLVSVAKKLELRPYLKNYYSVDGLLYSVNDLVPDSAIGQFWFRSLTVAFEHENAFSRNLYQEIAHLLILRARLSVVVTYSPKFDENLMNYFHSIIKPCPHAAELSAQENFLIILGRRDPLEWDGFVYTDNGWRKLPSQISS